MTNRVNTRILAQLLVLAWPASSAAQPSTTDSRHQQAEPYRIGVEVNLVTVPVTVRGPRGTFVKGLPQSAFRVLEDGRDHEIVTFAQEGVPLRVALVLDTSGSVESEWSDIAVSTRKFVEQMKLADKVALVTFNEQARLRLDWGHHADKIGGVLGAVSCKGMTSVWDAVWVTSKDLFRDIRGRKVIILMTDGLDNTSTIKFDEMLDAAIRSETAVYVVRKTEAVRSTVLNNKNFWTRDFVQADLSLQRLAEETGGRVLDLDASVQLDTVYRQVYEELRSQYTIGYVSTNRSKDGKYRRIQVLVDHPDAEVSARLGYLPENASLPTGQATGVTASAEPSAPVETKALQTLTVPEPQKNSDGIKIAVEVNMVTVPVTVRGADGSFLKGLPQSAFQVFEDGREQEIVTFAQEKAPAHIALVLDTSSSVRDDWVAIKNTAKRFAALLHPEDRFALVTVNDQARLRIDWGNRPETLDPVIGSIYCKGGTNLWDALWLVGNEVFKGVQGKKAVIMISDGLDNSSSVSYEDMRDAAVRSQAMFYVVSKTQATRKSMQREMERVGNYQQLPWKPFSDAERSLKTLAEDTGGRLLQPDIFGKIGDVYDEVFSELRNQYSIGYISNNTTPSGGYRRIRVVVEQRGARVYARPGYFTQNQLPQIMLGPKDKTDDDARVVVLQRGTPVFLRLAETLTSRRKPGDIVQMEVYKDVKVGNLVVLAKGAHAWATIDSGTRGPRILGIGGDLTIEVNGAHAVTGELVQLRASSAQHGEDIIPDSALAAALMLLIKGKHAEVPKGTAVLAYVTADASMNATLLRTIDSKLAAGKSPGMAGASERAIVHIYGKGYHGGFSYRQAGKQDVTLAKPSVLLDGAEVARIRENRFLTIEVAPGKHTFTTDRSQLELKLAAGQEVYLRVATQGFLLPKGYIKVASVEEAEEEMYPLAPVNLKDVREPWRTQGTANAGSLR